MSCSLDHPHILRLCGFFEEPARLNVVLEFASQGDVLHLMNRTDHRNRCRLARKILWQVCQALAYLECVHVAHRDIKPENILVVDTLRFKLGDFGWAVWYKPGLARNSTLCGTPEYVPPEVLDCRYARYNAELVDTWMLGVLAIELMQGSTPFRPLMNHKVPDHRITFQKIRSFQSTDQIGLLPRVSYRDMVRKLLSREPLDRCQASEMLNHPFFAKMGKPTLRTYPTVAQRRQLFQNT